MKLATHENARIGVVGAGSWGTALANLLAEKGYGVDLWVFETEVCRQIASHGENRVFLPGVSLSRRLTPSTDLSAVAMEKDMILVVVPSHVMRRVGGQLEGLIDSNTVVVTASKGIENQTHLTMSGVLADVIPSLSADRLAALSGPSFAKEVAQKAPTVVTVACRDLYTAEWVQSVFSTPFFRVYTNTDVIGVELGGAVKNVIALAAGVIDGLGLGLNTRAALITRGLAELQRLGAAMGADPRTLAGIAGVGDLILTCTGSLSRNHTVGKKLGEGLTLDAILGEMRMVAEGVKTATSVYNLSRRLGVEMPICEEAYRILHEKADPKDAVFRLMTRELKPELE
ncbi:MAG: NAD(P)H-dependent glycerol-3-phosphate dehydrogenase [Desulfobacterales bacterium]|jgi:glycerol-3-phosphate dehydrogenase (NAD(P)+)